MKEQTRRMSGDFYSIYKIECKTTGRIYIGKTIYAPLRIYHHLNSLRNGKHYILLMQNDFNLYGEQAFSFDVLEQVERIPIPNGKRDFLYTDALKEKEYMSLYKSYLPQYGYNYRDSYFKSKNLRHIKTNQEAICKALGKTPNDFMEVRA